MYIAHTNSLNILDGYSDIQENSDVKKRRWSVSERKELVELFSQGMPLDSLSRYFQRDSDDILDFLKNQHLM